MFGAPFLPLSVLIVATIGSYGNVEKENWTLERDSSDPVHPIYSQTNERIN